jgi:hypothetical protein
MTDDTGGFMLNLKIVLALLAFAAAILFFACAAFDATLGSVHLLPAGFVALASGLFIQQVP